MGTIIDGADVFNTPHSKTPGVLERLNEFIEEKEVRLEELYQLAIHSKTKVDKDAYVFLLSAELCAHKELEKTRDHLIKNFT